MDITKVGKFILANGREIAEFTGAVMAGSTILKDLNRVVEGSIIDKDRIKDDIIGYAGVLLIGACIGWGIGSRG